MNHRRLAPLIGSLWLAAGFVAVRVFWRLFLGEFSWPAVWSAVALALPFAALIMACGALSSAINPQRLLVWASSIHLGRSIATAMAIGFNTVPELARSVKRIREAQRLRGSRRASAVIVPLLEHTVERSLAIAAALDLRGFGARTFSVPTSDSVEVRDVNVHFDAVHALKQVSLTLKPGTLTVLTGPTGGGKTTLLETIAGLTEHFHAGSRSGDLRLFGVDRSAPVRHTARLISLVQQQVRLGFVGATVGEELEFTARLLKLDRLPSSLKLPSGQQVETLSAGEAVTLALESALLTNPKLLLLDEPFADLDDAARSALIAHIRAALDSGTVVVVAEHHTDELATLAPCWLTVKNGEVSAGRWRDEPIRPARIPARIGTDLSVAFALDTLLYRGELIDCSVRAALPVGSLVAVQGPNGAGKSSLLAAIAASTGAKHPNPARIALVPEDSRDLFARETLAEELAWGDKLAGVPSGLTKQTFRSLLADADVDSLLGVHPRDLSTGTQRALAIALQLSHKPALIAIDEPTRGLDPVARGDMAEVLRCVAETGTVVLFATHDSAFSAGLADEVWQMRDGVVTINREVSRV